MMLTEIMKEQKLLTGVWWVPLTGTTDTKRTRSVSGHIERQFRTVTYELTDGNTQTGTAVREFRGFIERHSSAWEPLALYIRLLYGDGIFYSRTDGGMLWLLIVNDGVIVPGTDCLMSPVVFDSIMEDRKFSQYKALSVRELTQDYVQEILTHYQANQIRLKKRRYFMYGALVCLGLVLLAIPTAFILIG